MPTVIVNRDELFRQIGENFTDERFDEICFEFGIELDEITSEKEMFENEQKKAGEGLSNDVLYKIEVPANRYDLLCIEGLSMALRIFLGKSEVPQFRLENSSSIIHTVRVEDSVAKVRPYFLSAILRDITFTDESLISFMELQDKLHNNICRGRSLVSMGTHDLDSVQSPFYYRAIHRDILTFVPLNKTENVTGTGLLEQLKNDHKLKYYVPLLANEDLFPAFCDFNGIVMSVPPLLNSDHSKLKLSTKNVLIDVTAKDLTKANIVLNTLVAMFSVYCKKQFTVEQVNVISATGKTINYPNLTPRNFTTNLKYLNKTAGTDLKSEEISKLLLRMSLASTVEGDNLQIRAPITRSDVIHACDIAEDLAISFGYNNIEKKSLTTVCNGYQQPINKLTDLIRQEMAMSGYIECLTMALISKKEMYTNMLNEYDEKKAVVIYKSKTAEFEVFRSSLIPGLLKSIEANKANQV
jgi:phenylalanyl-tRNA synthetase beta chain